MCSTYTLSIPFGLFVLVVLFRLFLPITLSNEMGYNFTQHFGVINFI